MTLEALPLLPSAAGAVTHPLDSLRADEIDECRRILVEAGLLRDGVRVAYMGVHEPEKSAMRAGGELPRVLRVMLLEEGGLGSDVRVSLTAGTVLERVPVDADHGQIGILVSEFQDVEAILRGDERWLTALAARSIDPARVIAVPLSAGDFGIDGEKATRIVRVLGYLQETPDDQQWARPVGGLVAYVDLTAKRVTEVVDDHRYAMPVEDGNFHREGFAGPDLAGVKPLAITQPEGPSFEVEGEEVAWMNWRFRLGFDHREGLVLHTLSFRDGDEDREILHRASIGEMVVPYGDPDSTRFWQNYFDVGEYLYGRYANPLKLGCDCVGDIRYFDAHLSDEQGRPRVIENAICMHEEDAGTLWKHTDKFVGFSEVRRQRRLVISFFTTVGNYDYGIFWYLYLDGTIECEAKLTGVLFTTAYPEDGSEYQSKLTDGLGAPFHQHLFNARLDMTVDGVCNSVDEIEAERVPIGPGNPRGNAFTFRSTRLRSESEGQREASPTTGRVWHVSSSERTNRVGEPTAYALVPQGAPVLLADPESSVAGRAAFATKHLWVTRYDPSERYPAGDFVNQSPVGEGLPAYASADRDIDGQDIVLWHTFGPTHFPRLEDWPVMPVDTAGFQLRPVGFFDRNPALNVPRSVAAASHCASGHGQGEDHHGDHGHGGAEHAGHGHH